MDNPVTAAEWLDEAVSAHERGDKEQHKYALGRLMRNYPQSAEAESAAEIFNVALH